MKQVNKEINSKKGSFHNEPFLELLKKLNY